MLEVNGMHKRKLFHLIQSFNRTFDHPPFYRLKVAAYFIMQSV